MEELQKIKIEKLSYMAMSEKQKGRVVQEIEALDKRIDEEVKEDLWAKDMDITRLAMELKSRIKFLLSLLKEDVRSLNEFADRSIAEAELALGKVSMMSGKSEEKLPSIDEDMMPIKVRDEFVDKMSTKVAEWRVVKNNDPKKAQGKYMALFKEAQNPYMNQKKEIIKELISEVEDEETVGEEEYATEEN